MKFTLSWLKDHLDTTASLDEIVETLTRIGLEVEGVEDKAKTFAPYTVAYVVSAEQHPNADRLRVCVVDVGEGAPIQVVCGAPNARTGMKSVFAPPGTYIPGKNITLGDRHHPRRRKPGHAVLGGRTRNLRRSRRHHRSARRRARRAALRGLCGPRRPGHRDQPHAQPARLHVRLRDRARSRGGRPRDAEEPGGAPHRKRGPMPRLGNSRFRARRREAVPRLRPAPRARRQEWPFAGMDAAPACCRSACARSTRSSTSPTT